MAQEITGSNPVARPTHNYSATRACSSTDRVLGFGPRGCGFESRQARHILPAFRPTGDRASRRRLFREAAAPLRSVLIYTASPSVFIQHGAMLARMVGELHPSTAAGGFADCRIQPQRLGSLPEADRLLLSQAEYQRPAAAHRLALVHAYSTGRFGRKTGRGMGIPRLGEIYVAGLIHKDRHK